jgi:hypothetical protein
MGRRITLQDWQHIAIAISKKLARNQRPAKADFEDMCDEDTVNFYSPGNTRLHVKAGTSILFQLRLSSL